MAEYAGFKYVHKKYNDNQVIDHQDIAQIIQQHPSITHVSLIHSETTSGLINDVPLISSTIKSINPNIVLIVDAMSSFGAHYIHLSHHQIDFLVSSSNKCIQGGIYYYSFFYSFSSWICFYYL